MADYNDNYSTCAETYSSLRIISAAIAADEISRRLRLEPTRSHAVGDLISPHEIATRPHHGWFLETRGIVESLDSRRHIDWLLDRVAPAENELRDLIADAVRADVFSYWRSANGHGGPMLSPVQMSKLARLGLDCGWDVYFPAAIGSG